MKISLDMAGVESMLDKLDGDIQKASRVAAQAGAEVLYRAVLRNVEEIGSVTGNLRNSIYQVFDKYESTPRHAIYKVSWRTAYGSGLPRAPHGHLLEFGYLQKYKVYLGKDGHWYTDKRSPLPVPKQRKGYAFMRRAQSEFGAAQAAAEKKLLEQIR